MQRFTCGSRSLRVSLVLDRGTVGCLSLCLNIYEHSKLNLNSLKSKLDIFLKTVEDTPDVPNRSNSLLDLIKETVRGGMAYQPRRLFLL